MSARRREGGRFTEGDLAQIRLAITEAMEPFVKELRTDTQTLFGPPDGGIVEDVQTLKKYKTNITAYVIAGSILFPVIGWAIRHFFW